MNDTNIKEPQLPSEQQQLCLEVSNHLAIGILHCAYVGRMVHWQDHISQSQIFWTPESKDTRKLLDISEAAAIMESDISTNSIKKELKKALQINQSCEANLASILVFVHML